MSGIADFVAAAERAAELPGSSTADLRVGPATVRVELAGPLLTDLLRRGLLEADATVERPGAHLYAFETAASGVPAPPPPWPVEAFDGRRHEIDGFIDPPEIATFDIDHSTLNYWDERAAAGVQWFRDAASMMPGEGGAPLRNLLRWALSAQDVHLLHVASATGVLFGGPGGAGKSTSSLACALAGEPFTSDDFTAVTLGEEPTAHAVFACIKATDETLALLDGLSEIGEHAGRDWRGKLRIDVRGTITRSQRIHAVVLPEQAERTGEPRPVDAVDALRRLTGGSLPVMVGGMAETMAGMRELLERVPSYVLPVGPDTENIAPAVAALAPAGSAS